MKAQMARGARARVGSPSILPWDGCETEFERFVCYHWETANTLGTADSNAGWYTGFTGQAEKDRCVAGIINNQPTPFSKMVQKKHYSSLIIILKVRVERVIAGFFTR